MAVWSYPCYPCEGDGKTVWYVSVTDVEEFSFPAKIVRVKVRRRWCCAALDRSRKIKVEGILIRAVVPTDAAGCEECRGSEA